MLYNQVTFIKIKTRLRLLQTFILLQLNIIFIDEFIVFDHFRYVHIRECVTALGQLLVLLFLHVLLLFQDY